MNDKELADAVVALGIGEYVAGAYWLATGPDPIKLDSSEFVRDPRVAMALMEKCIGMGIAGAEMSIESGYGRGWEVYNCFAKNSHSGGGDHDYRFTKAENESLPRAIIEPCTEALK